ncbi:MAG: PAS domain S-box protein [Armatimonadetes bacterium]|nr:PAS domain S-box protein [Armatimonadota bacterium]
MAATVLITGLALTPVLWRSLARQAESRLIAAATLKREQVVAWRDRCLADAAVLGESQFLVAAVHAFFDRGAQADDGPLLARFASLRQHYGYADLLLVDTSLRPRLTLHDGTPPLDPSLKPALAEAIRTRRPTLTDIHLDQLCDQPHVGVVTPLTGPVSARQPIRAALVMVVHAPDQLYPLLASWPEPTQTGSASLVRRDGEQVLYLSNPHGRSGAALSLTFPLARRELPCVQAVLGAKGLVHGRNELGTRVTAYVEPIAGTTWYLTSELAHAELYGSAYWQCLLLLAGTLGLAAALASLASGLWHRRQHRHFESLYLGETKAGEQGRILQTLLSNLPGMAYRCRNDSTWTLQLVSSGCEALTGYAVEELLDNRSLSYNDIIHPDDRDMVWQSVQNAVEKHEPYELVYRIIARDGTRKWVWERGCGFFRAEQLEALEGFICDITDRHQAEKQVLLLGAALDHMDDAAYLITEDARFYYVNEGACRQLGYTKEELAHLTICDIDLDLPPEHWPALWQQRRRGGLAVFETRHRTRSGEIVPVEVSAQVVRFEGVEYDLAVARNITERQRAEQALSASESHFRGVLERVDLIAVELDADGRIVFCNDYLLRLTGWTREELLGEDWFGKFVPARDRVAMQGVLGEVVGELDPHVHHENIILTRGGDERWVHWSNTVQRDGEGRVRTVVCLGEDITDRQRAEAATTQRLLTLTAPGDAGDVAFEDLFDVAELQQIQDAFAAATGVASIITRVDGSPITQPSNFCRLCNDVIRRTERGLANCICSDAAIGRHNPGGPLVQPCLSGGLWDAGASITVGGRHVANWLIGQVKNERLDEAQMLAYAREIGADEAEFAAALAEVSVMSSEQFERVARALYLVASELSQSAYQNVLQAREISHRRVAETALAESERRLEAAQVMAHLGHWELRLADTSLTWSDEVYAIFGASPATFDGTQADFAAMVHPDDAGVVLSTYEQSVADGSPGFEIEHRILRRDDGEVRWVHEKCVHQRDADGQVVRSLGMVQDITERKRAESERLRLQDQLAQAQKMESVGRLAGGVAHDFNNMLGVILGHVELAMADLAPGSPLRADLLDVQSAAQRSADLTRQLLAFARRQTVVPRLLDLNQTVTDSLKMLRRLIGEQVELDWSPHAGLWPVRMDPSQVDQMLANLCVNARDAIGGVGSVRIATHNVLVAAGQVPPAEGMAPGEWVLLSVSDTGHGMDAETAAQVFEPFFTTKDVGQGTGLGLATVYGVVRQNEGFITVDSQLGHGTTFRIYLPRCAVEPSAPAAPSAAVPYGSGQTVLLVEDEPAILRMARRLLEGLGYTVLVAETPGQAIDLAGRPEQRIDLLLTDVVMPEMNGRDLAEQLHRHRPGLACLFMSGYTADVIAHQGVLDPGMHFIQKPFTRSDLAVAVHSALR